MYKVAFEKNAAKEFLKLDKTAQELFANDKALRGKQQGKYRKRAGDYRIIYLRENDVLLITVIRVAHRKEVY